MAAWRLVKSLDVLRGQMMHTYATARANTSDGAWGTIGDAAHDPTSDHSPHTYAALGSTPVVCADDFPHVPQWGLDFGKVAEALRLSRDPRIGYVIFDARIFYGRDRNGVPAFTWQAYSGKDLHKTHGHVSSVHTGLADDTRQWSITPFQTAKVGKDMQLVVKFSDRPETFITDGITSRWLPDGDAVKYTLLLGKNGWTTLGNSAHGDQVCVLGPEQIGILGTITNKTAMPHPEVYA